MEGVKLFCTYGKLQQAECMVALAKDWLRAPGRMFKGTMSSCD